MRPLPGDHRGHHARRAGKHRRRQDCERAQPQRPQLHLRRSVCVRTGRGELRGRGAGQRSVRRRPRGRGRREPVRNDVREVLQDPSPLGHGHSPLCERRRRIRAGRRLRAAPAETAGGCGARRRPHLRGHPGHRRLERREGQGHHRTESDRSAPCHRARVARRRAVTGNRHADRGPWHLHRCRRPRRGAGDVRGVRRGGRSHLVDRARIGEVEYRTSQGSRGSGRSPQDRACPA